MKRKLIWRYIRNSDRWERATALSVFIASVLVIGLLNVWISFYDMLVQDVVQKEGSYHVMVRNTEGYQINEEKLKHLKGGYEHIGKKCALTEQKFDQLGGKQATEAFTLSLEAADQGCLDLCPYLLKQGRLPENDGEIAVSCGISLEQDYIYRVVPVGETVSVGGKAYTITGYLDDFVAGQEEKVYRAVTRISEVETPTAVYLEFSGDIQRKIEQVLDCLGLSETDVYDEGDLFGEAGSIMLKEECAVVVNADLLALLREGPSNTLNKAIFYGILFVVFAVAVFGAIIIGHIQGICFQNRKGQMSLLQLCGMSRGGIFAIIFGESILSGVVMMGAGTLCSYGLERVLFHFIQGKRSFALENFEVGISLWATLWGVFVIVIVLAVSSTVTWLKICRGPIVGSACRISASAKHPSARLSRMNLTWKMTVRFLTASPVRFLFCVLSMSASIVMVIVFLSFTGALQQKTERNIDTPIAQYGIFSNHFLHLEELLETMPYVESRRICFSTLVAIELDRSKYLDPEDFYGHERILDDGTRLGEIGGIDKEFFEQRIRFVDGKAMSYEEWAGSGTCLVGDFCYEDGECRRMTCFKRGDTVTYRGEDSEMFGSFEGRTMTVGGIVQLEQYNRNMDGERGCVYYLPLENLSQYIVPSDETIRINAKPGKEAALGEWLDQHQEYYDYYINDNVTEYMQANDTRNTIKVSLLAIATLILLLCVINCANSQVAEFEARKSDYTVMYLLGYGRSQFVRIILSEQAVQLFISVAVGVVGAVLVTEKVLAGLLNVESVTMGFPLFYIMCSFWLHVVAVLISMVPIVCRLCRKGTFIIKNEL